MMPIDDDALLAIENIILLNCLLIAKESAPPRGLPFLGSLVPRLRSFRIQLRYQTILAIPI